MAPGLRRMRDRRVVVAVSGGPDSVGLLLALAGCRERFNLGLVVAHVDHSTRNGASAEEGRFVADLAARLGLEFVGEAWEHGRPGHFEADARSARYAILAAIAGRSGAQFVATGHTLDDQAETVLHRALRGTGVDGLAGIPRVRNLAPGVALVRPLLDVRRREVADYLADLGQPCRIDASNFDHSQTRARLRGDLIPKMSREYNPRVVEALAGLADRAAEARRCLARQARRDLRKLDAEVGPARITLALEGWSRLPPAGRRRAARLAWRVAGWPEGRMTADRWRDLAAIATQLALPGGVRAWVEGDRVVLHRRPVGILPDPSPRVGLISLPVPGWVEWPGGGRVVATPGPVDGDLGEVVDLDRVEGSLAVRSILPGDRFDPLGLDGHTRRLVDVFRSSKVAPGARPGVPIVVDERGVVAVLGHRIAHRVRITPSTARRLGLRLEPSAPPDPDLDPGPSPNPA